MTRTGNALRPHAHVPEEFDHAPPQLLVVVAPVYYIRCICLYAHVLIRVVACA